MEELLSKDDILGPLQNGRPMHRLNRLGHQLSFGEPE